MNRRTTLILSVMVLLASAFQASAQHYDRGFDISHPVTFVQKGTWMFGGTGNYAVHDYDNYKFLVAEGITSTGYNVTVSPAFSYIIRDNLGVGLRIDYSRKMFDVDSAAVNIAETGIAVNNYHYIRQKFTAKLFLRNYIPIVNSRRFAMFNETQLSYGMGQGKVIDGHHNIEGTYSDLTSMGINLCPGFMAFATDHLAVEMSVNMLGLNINHERQTHNQVYTGDIKSTSVNFRVNVLSVGFGLYYYL